MLETEPILDDSNQDSDNLLTYGEERELKKMSTLSAIIILTKSCLGLSYFTFQITIGQTGLILSLIITVLSTIVVGYAIWRTCVLANMLEEMPDQAYFKNKNLPKKIRTIVDLCRYSSLPNTIAIIGNVTAFFANLFGVFVFMTNVALFFSQFFPWIPIILLKIIIVVIFAIPFFFFQVPEDLQWFSNPSIIMFNGLGKLLLFFVT